MVLLLIIAATLLSAAAVMIIIFVLPIPAMLMENVFLLLIQIRLVAVHLMVPVQWPVNILVALMVS